MKNNHIKTRNKINLPKVRYSLDLYKEGKYFIGVAKGLDYTGVGRTIDEAIKKTNKSVRLALEWCYKNRTLEKALKEAGFYPTMENNRKIWIYKNYLGNFSEEVA